MREEAESPGSSKRRKIDDRITNEKIRHYMVQSNARMHFGKEAMRRSILGGCCLRWGTIYIIFKERRLARWWR